MMKRSSYILCCLLSIVLLSVGTGCSDTNEEGNNSSTFLITSEDLGYVRPIKQHSVNVPFAGGTYNMTVKATDDVQWSVAVTEGSDFVTVSPTGNQTGNGEVAVTVASNTDKRVKTAKLFIQNSVDNTPVTIILRQVEKELYIPEGSENQTTADFEKETSKYNKHYMIEGDNVAIFWDRAMGRNPNNAQHRFDKDKLLTACEEVYTFLTDKLKFASSPNSYGNKYKLLVFVQNTANGTAWGGGDKNVGKLWLNPGRINESPFNNIIYHEMCHSFQYISRFDGANGFSGSIHEMTSQWALLRKYPDWAVNLERSHFDSYINQTHLAMGHDDNAYHDPFFLEYWTVKHGEDFISRMWQENTADDGGDYISTYMRLTGIKQIEFNAEVYDAAAHFMNWDLPSIHNAHAQYGCTNVHECELEKEGESYRISNKVTTYSPKGRCPQNYGYNGIKLKVPSHTSEISINFRGLIKAEGFDIKNKEYAEWRFGFVAVKQDGTVDYGAPTIAGADKMYTARYNVPKGTIHLWLVVVATPKTYFQSMDNEWPYQFELKGTEPDNEYCKIK